MKTRRKFFFLLQQLEQEEDVFSFVILMIFFCVALFGGAGRRIGEWTTPTSDVAVEWDVEM